MQHCKEQRKSYNLTPSWWRRSLPWGRERERSALLSRSRTRRGPACPHTPPGTPSRRGWSLATPRSGSCSASWCCSSWQRDEAGAAGTPRPSLALTTTQQPLSTEAETRLKASTEADENTQKTLYCTVYTRKIIVYSIFFMNQFPFYTAQNLKSFKVTILDFSTLFCSSSK